MFISIIIIFIFWCSVFHTPFLHTLAFSGKGLFKSLHILQTWLLPIWGSKSWFNISSILLLFVAFRLRWKAELIAGMTLPQRALFGQLVQLVFFRGRNSVTLALKKTSCTSWNIGPNKALCRSVSPVITLVYLHVKVTSGTCIYRRDPATKSIQNSLFVRRVVPCIQTWKATYIIAASRFRRPYSVSTRPRQVQTRIVKKAYRPFELDKLTPPPPPTPNSPSPIPDVYQVWSLCSSYFWHLHRPCLFKGDQKMFLICKYAPMKYAGKTA